VGVYEIRLRGCLDPQWADWFAGLTLTYEGDDTALRGELADEAALHGVLTRVRDLHVRLLSVQAIEGDTPAAGMPAALARQSPMPDAQAEDAAVGKRIQQTNAQERRATLMSSQLLRGAGSYYFEGSPVGCILVHGMGSTPYQVRSLGEYLAWQGLTVLGMRLTGHGTTLDELERTTSDQWLAAIDEGIEQLWRTCAECADRQLARRCAGDRGVLAIAARARSDWPGDHQHAGHLDRAHSTPGRPSRA
jgi:hypothetical protein